MKKVQMTKEQAKDMLEKCYTIVTFVKITDERINQIHRTIEETLKNMEKYGYILKSPIEKSRDDFHRILKSDYTAQTKLESAIDYIKKLEEERKKGVVT